MITTPKIEDRPEQQLRGDPSFCTDGGDRRVRRRVFPGGIRHLERHGVHPAGAPFLRYNLIDMEGALEIEAGVPVPVAVGEEGRVFAGVVPAGRYGTLTHTGDYEGLVDANEALQEWARTEGLGWAMTPTEHGDRFESRLEVYLTDPSTEPDPAKWETEVAYLLAES
jgi:effector-binding domain-containing protein